MFRRKRTWILLALAGLLALGLSLVLILLHTPLPAWLVNKAVDRYVQGPLGADVHIGDVGGDVLGSFCFEDISVEARNGRFRGQIDAISLHYDWHELVRRRWQLRRVDLERPVLYLAPTEKAVPAETVAVRWPAATRLPAIPDVGVDELHIFTGRLEDVHGPQVDSLSLWLSLRAQRGHLSLSLHRGHLLLPRKDLRLRLTSAELSLSPDSLEVLKLDAQINGSRLSMAGCLALSPAFRCSLQVAADPLRLQDAGQILGRRDIPTGLAQLNLQACGDSGAWRGHLELGGQAGRYRLDHLETTFLWQDQVLELDQLSVRSPGVDVQGRGHLRLEPSPPEFSAHLLLQGVDLSAILPQAPASHLSGRLLAEGRGRSLATLQARADVDLQQGMVAGRAFQSLRGRILFHQGKVTVPEGLELNIEGGRVFLAGSMDAQQEVDAWAQVEVSDVGRLLGHPRVSGFVRAQVNATGPARNPRVAGQIEFHRLVGDGHSLGSARGSFGLAGAVTRQEGFFSLKFFELRSSKLVIDQGRALGRFAEGKIFLDEMILQNGVGQLSVRGQAYRQEGRLEAVIDSLAGEYRGLTMASLTPLSLAYQAGQLRIEELHLGLAGGEIVVRGTVGPQSSLSGHVQLQDVGMDQLAAVLISGHQLAGRISADLVLAGSARSPEIKADFGWHNGRYDQLSFTDLQGKAVSAGELLVLESLLLEREDARFEGRGSLSVDLFHGKLLGDAPWDLALSGKGSSLGILSFWVPDMERLDGPFTVEWRASGTPHQPHYDGHLDLQDASLKLAPLGNTIQRLSAELHLDGQYVVIDHLKGETLGRERNVLRRIWAWIFPSRKRGRLESFGRINLADVAFDLTAKGRKIYLDYLQEQVEAEVDFNLRMTGQKRPLLGGQVTVLRALIGRPMASTPRVATESAPPPVDVDLMVNVPKNCWLRNEAAEIELRGQMRVLLQEGRLGLLGSLETVRGTYFFYGNSFRIDRGQVTFDAPESINPELDIEAWTEVDRERVELTIGGRMKSPSVALSSSSGYGEGDIISLLALRQSSAGLDTLSTQDVVTQQAGSVFGSYLQEAFNRKASHLLGVEEFRIQPDAERQLDLTQAQLTVGTYLSSRMYVEYSRRLSLESGEQVGVEYSLSRYLSLTGHRDNQGLYRLGFSLKWDY